MRISPKPLVNALALVVLTAAPLLASPYDVRFFDGQGTLLVGCDVAVHTAKGERLATLAPESDGIYELDVPAGTKLIFVVSDEIRGKVRIETIAPVQGPFDVHLPLGNGPANDDCESPEMLGVPGSAVGSTAGAMSDPAAIAAATCGTSVSNPSAGVWYTVVGTGTELTATTCNPGTDYDSKISVYCDDCSALECIGGNDDQLGGFDPACDTTDIGANRGSTVTWCSEAGATYRIFVHGFSSATGSLELTVADSGTPCTTDSTCLPPVAMGACCTDIDCVIASEEMCGNLAGAYQGDDTSCILVGDVTTHAAMPNAPIPDNDAAGLSSTISVPDAVVVADVDVDLVVTHTFVGDLIVDLTHVPSGTTARLIDRPGTPPGTFGCSSNDYDVTLDDEGSGGTIEALCGASSLATTPTSPPSYTPNAALAVFDGLDASGDWTLTISDNASIDTGSLIAWSLHVAASAGSVCDDGTEPPDGDQQVTICHCPPGNPDNCQTITVGAPAVQAHLGHPFDHVGPCDGSEGGAAQFDLICSPVSGGDDLLHLAPTAGAAQETSVQVEPEQRRELLGRREAGPGGR